MNGICIICIIICYYYSENEIVLATFERLNIEKRLFFLLTARRMWMQATCPRWS